MKIEFETDEMTVSEMGAMRRLLKNLIHEADMLERQQHDDPTLEFPNAGDKK